MFFFCIRLSYILRYQGKQHCSTENNCYSKKNMVKTVSGSYNALRFLAHIVLHDFLSTGTLGV